jgi:hypothetical protein
MEEHQERPAKRGEAAWVEAREAISKRNAEARRAGKKRREAYELERTKARLAAETRRTAEAHRSGRGVSDTAG